MYVSQRTETRVIDNNEAVSAKISEIRKAMQKAGNKANSKDGFVLGIDASNVAELIDEGEESVDSIDEAIAKKEQMQKDIEYMLNNADMQAQDIIKKARFDAAIIIANAQKEAEEIKKIAKEEGMATGYEEGKNRGSSEIEQLKNQILMQKEEMEVEYNQMVENLEPDLVNAILEVFSKVTNVIAEDKKDIILTLVSNVLSGDEVSKNYIIRVSSEDVKFLRDNKDVMLEKCRSDVNIEIVEDKTLRKNQCLIDTDLGVFDASLDIQLENLINDIRILSCADKNM